METVLFISEQKIKDFSLIELNVDNKVLRDTIMKCQVIDLKGILTDELYDKVKADIVSKAGDTNYVMQYKELLEDYIQPYLVADVERNITVYLSYKITNKGALKFNDTSASSISSEDLHYFKDFLDNNVLAYKNNLVEYLKKEKLIKCGSDTNVTTGNGGGWYLPNIGCIC